MTTMANTGPGHSQEPGASVDFLWGVDPSPRAICCVSQAIIREMAQKWSSQDSNLCLFGMVASKIVDLSSLSSVAPALGFL